MEDLPRDQWTCDVLLASSVEQKSVVLRKVQFARFVALHSEHHAFSLARKINGALSPLSLHIMQAVRGVESLYYNIMFQLNVWDAHTEIIQ
jgi:hypothetical protein